VGNVINLIWTLIEPFLPHILGLGAMLAGVWGYGRSKVNGDRAKRTAQDAKAYRDTIERMQNEDAIMGDDPAILRGKLRNRNPKTR
jgi:hypothetical protein